MEKYDFVRMPVGTTEDDKNSFIEQFIRIFPSQDKESVSNIWDRYYENSVLQAIWDVKLGIVVSIMKVSKYGAFWEHSGYFLKRVPNVSEFDIEAFRNKTFNEEFKSGNKSNKNIFDIDLIIDKINSHGLDKLTKEEKDFLDNIK